MMGFVAPAYPPREWALAQDDSSRPRTAKPSGLPSSSRPGPALVGSGILGMEWEILQL